MNTVLTPFSNIYANDAKSPDSINIEECTIQNISKTFVVSRDVKGNIVSQYSDDIWDFSPYTSFRINSKINFTNIHNTAIKQEVKQLMLITLLFGSGRKSSSYAVSTIRNQYNSVIIPLASFAQKNKLSIQNIIENTHLLKQFITYNCTTHTKVRSLSPLLNLLKIVGKNISNIQYQENEEVLKKLTLLAKRFKSKEKQTLLIPSRILYNSTRQRWHHISNIENNIFDLAKFLEALLLHPKFAVSSSYKGKLKGQYDVLWSDAVKSYKLKDLFLKYQIKNIFLFKKFISSVQGTCKHLIHTYTGMRDSEVLHLKTRCVETSSNKLHVTNILGKTSKLEGREKTTKWVTSKEIIRVINILKKLNEVYAKVHALPMDELPLFISLNNRNKDKFFTKSIHKFSYAYELNLIPSEITITQVDKNEIEEIDYNKEYSDTKIGEIWKFSFHQYRRSLAVYSLASGLVSIGALQIQMKHLFREMTLYYANGASFAKKSFNIPSNHIANDINTVKVEVDTLNYVKNVIFSDENLYGAHGKFVEKNIKTPLFNETTYFLENREKIIQQFKNGELSYKETALGACTSIEKCDSLLTRNILSCIDCNSAIIKASKLDNVIKNQKKFLEVLNKDSIEYRTELKDLQELEKQKKLLGSN